MEQNFDRDADWIIALAVKEFDGYTNKSISELLKRSAAKWDDRIKNQITAMAESVWTSSVKG